MARRVALIVSLAVLISVLLGLHLRELVVRGPAWLFPLTLRHGELVVHRGIETASNPGRLADFAKAGLRPGDVLEEIHVANRFEGRPTNLGQLLDFARLATSEPVRLVVRRPSAGNARVELHVPAHDGPRRTEVAYALAYTLGIPIVCLIAALLLGLLRPEDTRAFAGSLMFLGLAGLFAFEPSVVPGFWRGLAIVGQVLSGYGAEVAFLWFFLIFPAPSFIEQRMPWLKLAAAAAAGIVASLALVHYAAALQSFETYARVQAIVPTEVLEVAGQAVAIALVLVGFVSLLANTLRGQSRDERRRMVIILTGTVVGLGSFVSVITYYSVIDRVPPTWVAILLAPVLAFFPLSFVYAIVRHRVLGTRFILRRGVQYVLVSGAFRLLLGSVAFVLLWLVLPRIIVPLWEEPLLVGLLAAAVVLLLGRGFRKVSDRVMPAIDRRFFRDAYDAQRVLSELSHSLRELALDPGRLLARVVDAISEALHPMTTAVFLREDGDDGRDFRCVTLRRDEGRPLDIATLTLPGSGVIASRILRGGAPQSRPLAIVPHDPRGWAHPLFTDKANADERAVVKQLGAQLIVPLVSGPRLLGMIVLGDKRSEEAYSRDDRTLLATVAEQTALALDYGQLARQAAREESLRREVEIARSVQVRMFPQELPPVLGLDYSGVCRPAREIGGDSYDFIALGPGRLGLSVADISGKGIAAALLMANLQALLRSHAPLRPTNPAELVADINRLLAASIPDNRFATFFYGVLDTHGGRLTYTNAGHNPPLLLRNGEEPCIQRLEPTGVMLGLFPDAEFEQRTVPVRPGDVLVVYSDGICDALNGRGEDYGDARLAAVVRANASLPAAELQERILADVTAFGDGVAPFDDMTLVVARVL